MKWKIYWANLNPTQGSEQSGQRPVLVVSNDHANSVLPVVTVLPLTSMKPGRIVYPIEAHLKASENGLMDDSIAMAHQIRALAKSRLGCQCGEVALQSARNEVEKAIRSYLEL